MPKIDCPVHIDTEFHDFCYKGCTNAIITLDRECFYANGEEYVMPYTLTCEKYSECEKLMQMLKNMQKDGK